MDQLDDGPPPPPVSASVSTRRFRVFVGAALLWSAVGALAYFLGPMGWRWYIFHFGALGYIATAGVAERLIR